MGTVSYYTCQRVEKLSKPFNQPTMKLAIASLAGLAAAHSIQKEWADFKSTHSKRYSPLEEERRFNIFKENKAFIERHNRDYQLGRETYTVGINKFADMTNDEFHAQYLAMGQETVGIRLNYQCPVQFQDNGNTADSVDWRTTANPQGIVAVTSVKDQGSCGSCWSFGGAAAFEGAQCIAGNHDCTSWTGASEQELVDCGNKDNSALGPYYDMACNGGWFDNALYYILQTGYIDSYDSYPYVSGTTRKAGTCQSNPANSTGKLSNCGAPKRTLNHNCKPLYPKSVHKVLPSMLAVSVSNCTLVVFTLLLLVPTPELTTPSPLSVMALTLPVLNTGLLKTLGVPTGVTTVTF